MITINELVADGTVRFARLPPNNPTTLNFDRYTLPLVAHDYPAKTPVMWNAAYRKLGLPVGNAMLVAEPRELPRLFDALRHDKNYLGGGIGVGLKDKVLPYLDEIEAAAQAIGAINFVLKLAPGRLRGFNTDGLGFAQSLAERFAGRGESLGGKRAVVLGAGGTSNAVVFALAQAGMRLFIVNRTVEKAKKLAETINGFYRLAGQEQALFGGEETVAQAVVAADAIINVSTKGSAGELREFSALAPVNLPATPESIRENRERASRIFEQIPKRAILGDVVLTDGTTTLLEEASARGYETLDGIPMVINQGVEAFWLAHGQELQDRHIDKERVKQIMQQAALG